MKKPKPKASPPVRKRVAYNRASASTVTSKRPEAKQKAEPPTLSKLDSLERALRAKSGATIPDLMEITGWQAHSVRGALAGALKNRRGLEISSAKVNGERRYRIGAST